MKFTKIFTAIFFVLTAFLFLIPCIFLNSDFRLVSAGGTDYNLPTVIVDAGHGGADGGAVAPDNTNEKDYNLDIALKLEEILKLNGFNVIMTRRDDSMTCDENLKTIRSKKISDIHNRFALTEKYSDAIFVSIHQNKFSDETQHGTQVFYSGNNPGSKALADIIQQRIKEALQPYNSRLTKKSGTEIYILYHSKIPTVLVECGFVSNYEELQKLKNDDYQTQLAMLIAEGIIKYRQGD